MLESNFEVNDMAGQSQALLSKAQVYCRNQYERNSEEWLLIHFLLLIAAGALLGGVATFCSLESVLLNQGSLASATVVGTVVGATFGLLVMGLIDVVVNGRLEETGCVFEEEDEELINEIQYIGEAEGYEDYFSDELRKAS